MTNAEDFSEADLRAAYVRVPDAESPSAAHLEELRRELLSRTVQISDRTKFADEKPSVSKPWRRLSWLSMATVVAVCVIAFLVSNPDQNGAITSFRQVLFETGRHPWVHGQTRVEFEANVHEFETWFSPSERLAAMRSPQVIQHTDFSTGRQVTFDRNSQQLTQGMANPHSEDFGRALILAILHDGDLQGAMPFHRVSDLRKLEVREDGVRLLRYQFQVAWRSNAAVGWETTVWVDVESQLIRSWEERHSNGTTVVTRFDYPADGPRDVHALGVPQEVMIRE
jgi:hypothetical protein